MGVEKNNHWVPNWDETSLSELSVTLASSRSWCYSAYSNLPAHLGCGWQLVDGVTSRRIEVGGDGREDNDVSHCPLAIGVGAVCVGALVLNATLQKLTPWHMPCWLFGSCKQPSCGRSLPLFTFPFVYILVHVCGHCTVAWYDEPPVCPQTDRTDLAVTWRGGIALFARFRWLDLCLLGTAPMPANGSVKRTRSPIQHKLQEIPPRLCACGLHGSSIHHDLMMISSCYIVSCTVQACKN